MSFENAVMSMVFAVGTVIAYQVTQQAPFGVAGGFFAAACLYKALKFDWS